MKKYILSFILFTFLLPAFAHEYILLTHQFTVVKGDTLEMHLFVSDGFNIEFERPMQKSMTREFKLLSKNGTTDLLVITKDEALPIVNRKVDFEGLGLLYMERDYDRVSLETDFFLEYLKEDYIENIKLNDEALSKKEQTERYSRYIKSLVRSDGDIQSDTLYKTVVGHDFEIILLQNPYLLKKGDTLSAKVLFKGKPLVNKVVTARNRIGNKPSVSEISRTDNEGICSFKLEREGEWFIHTTHMMPCPDKTDVDWESFWTSYSFGLK